MSLDQLFRFLAAGALALAPFAFAKGSSDAGLLTAAALVVGFFVHQVWYLLWDNVFALDKRDWQCLELVGDHMPRRDLRQAFLTFQLWMDEQHKEAAARVRGRLMLLHSFGTILLAALVGVVALLYVGNTEHRRAVALIEIGLAALAALRLVVVYRDVNAYQGQLAATHLDEIVHGAAAIPLERQVEPPVPARLIVLVLGLLAATVAIGLASLF